MDYLGFLSASAALVLTSFLLYRYYLAPASLARKLRLHYGLHVLPYRPPSGNTSEIHLLKARATLSHLPSPSAHRQILARVQPFYSKILSEHQGSKVVYWWGLQPRIIVTDPEEVKHILSVDFKSYEKSDTLSKVFHRLLGDGLLLAEGADWHNQRTMLRPAFFPDKLKGMISDMHLAALQLTEGWRQIVANSLQDNAEVEVARGLTSAMADILARTSFGSDYQAGKAVFENQDKLFHLLTKAAVLQAFIPGFRYLPTPNNIKCWKIERSIHKELSHIVHSRTCALTNTSKPKLGTEAVRTDDILSLMLASRGSSNDEFQLAAKSGTSPLTANQIIDECKTFFFAGHETTTHLLTWTMMLLSLHPDWQEKLREEIWEVCGMSSNTGDVDDLPAAPPDSQQINKLKMMSMVLNESLRLYPPVPEITSRVLSRDGGNEGRRAEEVKMGVGGQLRKLAAIAGMAFSIPTLIIQRDTSLWGEDANEFQPQRFEAGVAKAASHPSAFISFGFGPRTCIGQAFALLEAKIILLAILQRFRFRLSPSYKHAPVSVLTMKPQHGMQIFLELLV